MPQYQIDRLLDIAWWPKEWSAAEEPVQTQCAKLLPLFKGFLESLIDGGLALNTIRRHRDNLQNLGYVIGRLLAETPGEAVDNPVALLLSHIGEHGGPIHPDRYATESAQDSLDATSKKLSRYLAGHRTQ